MHFGPGTNIDIWASPSRGTLPTVAIVAEHLGRDFSELRQDPRLFKIDACEWEGRRHADIVVEQGPIVCPDRRAFNVPPPGGDHYPAIAARLQGWLADLDPARVALVISHGITLRVLRRGHQSKASRSPKHIAGADFRFKDGVPTALHFQAGGERARGVEAIRFLCYSPDRCYDAGNFANTD